MVKDIKLKEVQRQGSWIVFWIWMVIFFPVAIIYYLFKMKKVKTWEKK
ncbi:MAG TPA: hypothetical protein VMZ91_11550 [Candidatus Paceibacterota bacterium]|nr:hypothetical protein [Candidatus Paceibacterota bacterium]